MKTVEELKSLIEDYKEVLRMAEVPELIIEYPNFIKSMPITQKDFEWAKQELDKQSEKK